MPGRPGTVEHHPERKQIDAAIRSQMPYRRIAARWGVPETCIRSYVKRLPAPLAAALEKESGSAVADIIAEWREMLAMVRDVADKAAATPGAPAANLLLRAVDRVCAVSEGIGRLRGDLQAAAPPPTQVNVLNIQVNYGGAPAPIAIEGQVVPENGNGNGLAKQEG